MNEETPTPESIQKPVPPPAPLELEQPPPEAPNEPSAVASDVPSDVPSAVPSAPEPAPVPPTPSEADAKATTNVPPAPPSDAPPAPDLPIAQRLTTFLSARGLSPVALSLLGAGLAVLAGVLFLVFHPGLGGIIGLVALLASELALVPPLGASESTPLARALAPPVDLLVAGGLVAGLSAPDRAPDVMVLLALLVLLLVAWLPHLEGAASPSAGAALWKRADRLAILLLGALLGSILPALLIVAVTGGFDAWVRLERIRSPATTGGPTFLRPLLQANGTLVPAVRWGSLALAVLLLILLRTSEGWRF